MKTTSSSRAAKISVRTLTLLVVGLALIGLFGLVTETFSQDPKNAEGLNSALRMLEGGLTSAPPRLQRLAFTALLEYYCQQNRGTEYCAQLLSQGATHVHWQVRLTNLSTAFRSEIPEQSRRQVVEQAVQDDSPHIRRAVSKLLAEHPEGWEKKLLIKLVESPDIIVQEHAAAALIRLGKEQYAKVLEEGLRSGDRDVALEAARHVITLKIKGQAQAKLLLKTMLADRDEITRANVIYGLSELEDAPWNGGVIQRLLADDSPMVRLAMVSVLPLIRLPQQDAPGAFELLIKRWPEESIPEVRIEILNAVKQMERLGATFSTSVMRFVQGLMQDERDSRIRLVAMGILACHGQSQYREQLLAVAQDPKRELTERLFSLSSLGQCRDASIAGPLTQLMEEQDAEDSNAQAIRINTAATIVRLLMPRPAGQQL